MSFQPSEAAHWMGDMCPGGAWFGLAPCWRRLKKTSLFPLMMALLRGVCLPRSSSRFPFLFKHLSISGGVVAVNKSGIFHRTTTDERRREADLWSG